MSDWNHCYRIDEHTEKIDKKSLSGKENYII